MRCLVVEDDLMSRHMLKEMLPAHFKTDIAVNGAEAVTAFSMAHGDKRPYDLIFMDVEMPVLGGIEALCQIRELEKKLEIPPSLEVMAIMTTSHSDIQTIIDSLNKGGVASYMIKPLEIHNVHSELRKLGLLTSSG